MRRCALLALTSVACAGPAPGAPATPAALPRVAAAPEVPVAVPAAPAAPGIKVSLGDVGLESASLDRSVDPCVDFYQFACGGWLAHTPIPAGEPRWDRQAEIAEGTRLALAAILEEAAASPPADPAVAALGAFHAACMDEPAIEQAGLAPIAPLLARTTKVKDARSWLAAVAALHALGIPVVWAPAAEPDLEDATRYVTTLDAGRLGLPERDHYLDARFAGELAAYRTHVGALLALAGTPAAQVATAAQGVVAIETELARVMPTAGERRDLRGRYHPTDAAGLGKRVRTIDWTAYWKGLGVAPSKKLIVATPALFAALDRVRRTFTWAQWSSYFTYHLVRASALGLPRAFDAEVAALTGAAQGTPRARRCQEATTVALGDLLGRVHTERHVSAAARTSATALVTAVMQALRVELGDVAWMAPATRARALDKLDAMLAQVGAPVGSVALEPARGAFALAWQRAMASTVQRRLARAGAPVDRAAWPLDAHGVAVAHQLRTNTLAIPAGVLQAPLFGAERSVAANLGGLGAMIGHELIHGFDEQGAQFDAHGALATWWQPADAQAFAERGACVADQYQGFEALPGQFVDGRRTARENIADLGGVELAFRAYRTLRASADPVYVADGYTEDQQFFIAVAQAQCGQDRPTELQRRLAVDPQAPAAFRVYGALRNLPAFAQAFRCAAGTPMNPARTCAVW